MPPTKVVKCDCASDYQDKKYGQKNRLGNLTKTDGYRCTVCGKVIGGGVGRIKVK